MKLSLRKVFLGFLFTLALVINSKAVFAADPYCGDAIVQPELGEECEYHEPVWGPPAVIERVNASLVCRQCKFVSEPVQCADGVNNDPSEDTLNNCADPGCFPNGNGGGGQCNFGNLNNPLAYWSYSEANGGGIAAPTFTMPGCEYGYAAPTFDVSWPTVAGAGSVQVQVDNDNNFTNGFWQAPGLAAATAQPYRVGPSNLTPVPTSLGSFGTNAGTGPFQIRVVYYTSNSPNSKQWSRIATVSSQPAFCQGASPTVTPSRTPTPTPVPLNGCIVSWQGTDLNQYGGNYTGNARQVMNSYYPMVSTPDILTLSNTPTYYTTTQMDTHDLVIISALSSSVDAYLMNTISPYVQSVPNRDVVVVFDGNDFFIPSQFLSQYGVSASGNTALLGTLVTDGFQGGSPKLAGLSQFCHTTTSQITFGTGGVRRNEMNYARCVYSTQGTCVWGEIALKNGSTIQIMSTIGILGGHPTDQCGPITQSLPNLVQSKLLSHACHRDPPVPTATLTPSVTPVPPACSDGDDNDGDNLIDCTPGAEDPGCFPDGQGNTGECDPNDTFEEDTISPCAGQCNGNYSGGGDQFCDSGNVCIANACMANVCTISGMNCDPNRCLAICPSATIANEASLRIGSTTNFTCTAVPGTARYIFRIKRPSGTIDEIQNTTNISPNYTITEQGDYKLQCQLCTGATPDTCLAFEQM